MTPSALACAIGGCLILAEQLALRLVRHDRTSWPELVFNLNSGHILMWVFRGVEIAAYAAVLAHFNLHWVDRWPRALQWVFAFFAWDLCFYCRHRAHHAIGLLWSVHVVHHQGEHFDLSLCNRNSWYASITDLPFTGLLALIGLPLDLYVAVSSFHYAVQFFNHSGLVRSASWLDRFLVTPLHHRVHHRAEARYFNRNFGGTLLLWDKMFGTFAQADPTETARYGVDGIANSRNPLRASNEPILRHFGCAWPAQTASEARVLDGLFVAVGGALLYGLLICWLNQQPENALAHPSALMAATLFGTIALGAHCDARRWGLIGWIVLVFALPAMPALGFVQWSPCHAVPPALLLAFAAHGVWGLAWLLRDAATSRSQPQR
ncbi:sterol desaturase/sphingolipid hydroxylase (fatty acid hydroxylase superfamily) [Paraburkholderia eburnea]|uniref:Sterol desaturase/sphingolipid hydroxylase (Fatty acid hydroxylase superfamily) n=1 Tax=Paraburkholderia eburnea TaxID=1189126 RepID=A0A2S4LVK5_9BURK|nr:sterol desaturase family protein [Paraburkholderia eburnea]POR46470.1 sterol desaturase/sphingolipid hydroxylase (fatty acid hydroxylase superfamily) [Paraburkholderia eburnea]PRZ20829.1 sterol desaturase/sphingolipid hydroxylase (fatty acid hydroxylase superfamily) [Paraburkholderia eburnea]